MAKTVKQNRKNEKPQIIQDKPIVKKQRGWWVLAVKFVLLFSAVVALVVYTDKKGYFEPDQSNNHTSKKWNAFYEFTETDTVDVVLVGNSHCYAGVNPKNLSEAIGANCFVLASPGTSIMDSYYCLEEALERTHPVVAIIETYGISNSENRHLKGGGLSDQFKSFNARKNLNLKLSSMPMLFSLEQYVPAWSKSIRNHDFIFHDRTQLENNIKQSRLQYQKKDDKLYLGRFVSFTSGIEDTTIMMYDSLGAPVNGALREVNEENVKYVNKIVELCKRHSVMPVFVTLPMYYRHIEHYDAWKRTIDSVITPTGAAWLDLQDPYDTVVFDRNCFENTYNANQHMTYEGSVRGAYKIAHFLVDSLKINFPDRDSTQHWHDLFYGEEGYFENYPPREDDTTRVLICKDQVIDSIIDIKECTMVKGEKMNTVYLKIKRKADDELPPNPLSFLVEVNIDGERVYAYMDCWRPLTYDPLSHYLYMVSLKEGCELLEIKGLYKSF
jgi:hypothetical protein